MTALPASIDPSLGVAAAVYAALNGQLSIGSGSPPETVPVYDDVPQGADYPYVVIGDQIDQPMDGVVARRDDTLLYLSVWSTEPGQKQVKTIMGDISRLLHRRRLPMAAGSMIICTVIRQRSTRDADNVTRMGQMTLRILTED